MGKKINSFGIKCYEKFSCFLRNELITLNPSGFQRLSDFMRVEKQKYKIPLCKIVAK